MRRPNILILYTDQQRWDTLGVNHNAEIQTPNLDRLAADGVNFNHYFVQNPVCMPSRASFLTGQYPSALGITHMGVPVPEDVMTLPRMLQPYGYHSANIGKLHFLPHANRDHRLPHPSYGFTQLEISDEPGVYEDAYRAWVRRIAPEQLDYLSVGLPPATATWYATMNIHDPVNHPQSGGRADFKRAIPFPGDDAYTHSAFVADQTIEFLQQQRNEQPFLCIAGFYSPHAPWVVPQRFLDLYDPANFTLPDYPPALEAKRTGDLCSDEQLRSAYHGYYAMISEVDYHIGRILSQLDSQSMANDTIVIFTSDHGEWLGEHLRYGKGYPGSDAVSRVPCIVRWPAGIQRPGRTEAQIIEGVDIVPTLLDCAGIQVPSFLQGQSLTGVLCAPSSSSSTTTTHNGPTALDSVTMKTASALMEHTGWKTLRTAQYRYLIHDDGRESLWDLTSDPKEYRDIVTEPRYQPILAEHRRLLLQKLLAGERPLPRTWTY